MKTSRNNKAIDPKILFDIVQANQGISASMIVEALSEFKEKTVLKLITRMYQGTARGFRIYRAGTPHTLMYYTTDEQAKEANLTRVAALIAARKERRLEQGRVRSRLKFQSQQWVVDAELVKMAATSNGFSCTEHRGPIAGYTLTMTFLQRRCCALRKRGLMFSGAKSHKVVRYFSTQEAADRFSFVAKAQHKAKVTSTRGLAKDAPVIHRDVKVTIVPNHIGDRWRLQPNFVGEFQKEWRELRSINYKGARS